MDGRHLPEGEELFLQTVSWGDGQQLTMKMAEM
jgi:hypothetical protein